MKDGRAKSGTRERRRAKALASAQARGGGNGGPFRGAAPRPVAAHLAAGASDLAQAAALAAGVDDPRFPWRPSLRGEADALAAAPGVQDRNAFARAVVELGQEELRRALDGIAAYRATPALRRPAPPPVIWRRGGVRLLAFPPPTRPKATLIAIPSLVNGSAILDLSRARSFLRGLSARGVRCFMVDWGEPGPEERGFSVADYATLRALPALDAALARTDGPVTVLGHCMAGAIAAEAARFRLDRVEKLILMATPWDFATMTPEGLRGPKRDELATLIDICGAVFGGVPADVLNGIFFLRDPLQAIRKFGRFTPARRQRAEGRLFVAVEDWLNDGLRLSAPAAKTLFVDWALDNSLARGRWPDPARPLRLNELGVPILIAASRSDTLTPHASAVAAMEGLERGTLLEPRAGHVGMVVGGQAARELWDPLADWIKGD